MLAAFENDSTNISADFCVRSTVQSPACSREAHSALRLLREPDWSGRRKVSGETQNYWVGSSVRAFFGNPSSPPRSSSPDATLSPAQGPAVSGFWEHLLWCNAFHMALNRLSAGLMRKFKEVCVGQRSLLLITAKRIRRVCLPSRLGFSNPL